MAPLPETQVGSLSFAERADLFRQKIAANFESEMASRKAMEEAEKRVQESKRQVLGCTTFVLMASLSPVLLVYVNVIAYMP